MQDQENPLHNSLILSHVMTYLPYNDKKSGRAVCQLWNDEIRKALRRITRVRIEARGEKQLDNLVNGPPPSDPTFLSNFCFGPGVHLQNYLHEENQLLKQFFHIYGQYVKSLSINNCICSTEDLKAILYHGCPNLESHRFIAVITGRLFSSNEEKELLSNMKCLQVNVRSSDLVRNTEFMVDLLSVSPNLYSISWIKLAHDEVSYDRNLQLNLEMVWSAERSSSGLTIRDTIYDVAIHCSSLNLTKLDTIANNMRLSNASVLSLTGRHFPLRYLDITLVRDVYVSSLTTLLQSLSGTLKCLKIEFYPCLVEAWPSNSTTDKISQGNFSLPNMNKLQHLFLKRFSGSFRFVSGLEYLKTLSLCDLDIRECLHQPQIDLLHSKTNNTELSTSLKRFQVFWDDTGITHHGMTFSTDDIAVLAKAFPNVTEIRVVKGLKKRKLWFKRFEKLQVLEEAASERGIGGLKGPNKSYENNEYCYCCAHKNFQRLPGGGLSYWS